MNDDLTPILVLVLIAAGALGLLHTFAIRIRNETELHDLRVEVAELTRKYAEMLRAMYGPRQTGEVEIIEVDEVEEVAEADEAGPIEPDEPATRTMPNAKPNATTAGGTPARAAA